jgi:hypothetical protein
MIGELNPVWVKASRKQGFIAEADKALIEDAQDKLARATSPHRRDRLNLRIQRAQARLLAHKLATS